MDKKTNDAFRDLSRRERQIMEFVYMNGEATASEVLKSLPSPPTIQAVRRMLAILEEKDYLEHRIDYPKYIYRPTASAKKVRGQAISHFSQVFFQGSIQKTISGILDHSAADLSEQDLAELEEMIRKARQKGS